MLTEPKIAGYRWRQLIAQARMANSDVRRYLSRTLEADLSSTARASTMIARALASLGEITEVLSATGTGLLISPKMSPQKALTVLVMATGTRTRQLTFQAELIPPGNSWSTARPSERQDFSMTCRRRRWCCRR